MAIQFQCFACSQPIEVDDEWASRSVTCPFCRTTVTAPQASTFVPPADAPMASPAEAGTPLPGEHVATAPGDNALAVWALALSVSALVLYFVASMWITNLSVRWLGELAGPGATPEEIRRGMMEQVQAGNMPSWIMSACLLLFAVFSLWVAGIACGIMALRKPARRVWAVVALVLSGVLPLLFCIALGFSARPGG